MSSPVSKPSGRELEKTVEALLFVHGEPMTFSRLATASSSDELSIRQAVDSLSRRLSETDSAISVVIRGDTIQLIAASASAAVAKLIKEDFDSSLTPAALETLSVIAYLGPVSRARLDYLRGVNSTFILRSLLMRGLIDRRPDPQRSYTFIYSLSADCLNHLGVSTAAKLPDYAKYVNLLKTNPEPELEDVTYPSPETSLDK